MLYVQDTNRYCMYKDIFPRMKCFKIEFTTNKSCRYVASDQGTKYQMILGSLISSQDKPKVGVSCTVLDITG